jgi:hypothetical protein
VLLKRKSVRNKKTEDLKAFYGKFKSSSLYPHFFSSRQSESQQSTTKQLPVLLNRCLVSAPCRAALLFWKKLKRKSKGKKNKDFLVATKEPQRSIIQTEGLSMCIQCLQYLLAGYYLRRGRQQQQRARKRTRSRKVSTMRLLYSVPSLSPYAKSLPIVLKPEREKK